MDETTLEETEFVAMLAKRLAEARLTANEPDLAELLVSNGEYHRLMELAEPALTANGFPNPFPNATFEATLNASPDGPAVLFGVPVRIVPDQTPEQRAAQRLVVARELLGIAARLEEA